MSATQSATQSETLTATQTDTIHIFFHFEIPQ